MSEPSPTPPRADERVDAPERQEGAADPETTAFVQVTRRRAPRFRAFVLTGIVVAFLASAVVAASTDPAGGYSQRALFGYLFVSFALVGTLVGALVAVLADRRTGTRPVRRRRPRGR